jgi:RNA 3'-terminal phosphate cyclase (ATP)
MAAAGFPISLAMPRAGFYPRGGGRIEAWIEPAQPRPWTCLERGALVDLAVEAGSTRLPDHVRDRMHDRAAQRLADAGHAAAISTPTWDGPAPGAATVVTARYEHVTTTCVGLGERGKPAERVADEAVEEFLAYDALPGALDPHAADQVLLPLSLAPGASVYTTTAITDHLRTHIATIGAFLDRAFRVEEPDRGRRLPARIVIA